MEVRTMYGSTCDRAMRVRMESGEYVCMEEMHSERAIRP